MGSQLTADAQATMSQRDLTDSRTSSWRRWCDTVAASCEPESVDIDAPPMELRPAFSAAIDATVAARDSGLSASCKYPYCGDATSSSSFSN